MDVIRVQGEWKWKAEDNIGNMQYGNSRQDAIERLLSATAGGG